MEEIKAQTKEKMENSLQALQKEMQKLRTGQANISLLDSIQVDYYGTPTPLNQVAAISLPDARSFLITPWEASTLKSIETAIVNSNLGLSPQNDGKAIRLKVPELTEERRKEVVKQLHKILEDTRISLRQSRRDANEIYKKALKEKTISEDEQKRHTEETQKLTDEYVKKVNELGETKEADLLKV